MAGEPRVDQTQAMQLTIRTVPAENIMPEEYVLGEAHGVESTRAAVDHLESHNDEDPERGADRKYIPQANKPPRFTAHWRFEDYGASLVHLRLRFPHLRILDEGLAVSKFYIVVHDIGDEVHKDKAFMAVERQSKALFQREIRLCNEYMTRPRDRGTHTRLILVEDLCRETILNLGGFFDLDPEFFAHHLHGSNYNKFYGERFNIEQYHRDIHVQGWDVRNLYSDQETSTWKRIYPSASSQSAEEMMRDPSRWNTSHLAKPYRTLTWKRPVKLRSIKPSAEFILEGQTIKQIYPQLFSKRRSNIFRRFWEVYRSPQSPDNIDDMVVVWEERVSIYELSIDDLNYVILLLDPLPHQGDHCLFENTKPRGAWSVSSARAPRILLPQIADNGTSTTLETIREWLTDQWVTREICNDQDLPKLFENLFTIAKRDTEELLYHLQFYMSYVHFELLNERTMQTNILFWRRFITSIQVYLTDVERDLTSFVESYSDDLETIISSSIRWTSVDEKSQTPKDTPQKIFLNGRATSPELSKIQQDLAKLLKKIDDVHQKSQQTSHSLQGAVSFLESKRQIAEAESVTKLTELAFFFIPISFSASFFSMPVDLFGESIRLSTFVAFAACVLVLAYAVRLSARSRPIQDGREWIFRGIRNEMEIPPGRNISTRKFILGGFKLSVGLLHTTLSALEQFLPGPLVVGFLATITGVIMVWTLYHGPTGLKAGITVALVVPLLFSAIELRRVLTSDPWFEALKARNDRMTHIDSMSAEELEEHKANLPRSKLAVFWIRAFLWALLMISGIVAPIVLLWTIIPANIGGKVALTVIVVCFAPLMHWLFAVTIRRSEYDQRLRRFLKTDSLGDVYKLWFRYVMLGFGISFLARWLHSRPWRRRRKPLTRSESMDGDIPLPLTPRLAQEAGQGSGTAWAQGALP